MHSPGRDHKPPAKLQSHTWHVYGCIVMFHKMGGGGVPGLYNARSWAMSFLRHQQGDQLNTGHGQLPRSFSHSCVPRDQLQVCA